MSATMASNATPAMQRYRTLFDAQWHGNDAVTELRRAALEQFEATGFPTQRNEEWKYTNLRRLESRQFTLAQAGSIADAADQTQWIAHTGPRIVFLNGAWMQTLSTTNAQAPGATVLTLSQWLKNSPDEVAAYLRSHAAGSPSAFEHLNAAFFQDGIIIDISANVSIDAPIYVLHQYNAQAAQHMTHPRLIVRAGANSHCTIIEHYVGADAAEYFTNTVATIEAQQGATITHCRLQQESTRSFHIGTTRARLQRDAKYRSHDIVLGGSLGRSSIIAALEGSGAEVTLRGLFAPGGSQHLDVYTRIDHVAPHTTSHEEYRGIAEGRGRGVFNGKVKVHPNAQQIDARQSSRNLLLSPTAEIDTKPELEIYANDVKCSHGATTGQLDPVSLFYLRSRGLSESAARTLLIRAFAESILATIPCKSVHDHLETRIGQRFDAGAQT